MTAPTDRARAADELRELIGKNCADVMLNGIMCNDHERLLENVRAYHFAALASAREEGYREGRREALVPALEVVNSQAADEACWFIPDTMPEAYLQQELRRLHEAVEGVSQQECARRLLAAEKEAKL